MTIILLEDFGKWWLAEKSSSKDLEINKAIHAALRELGTLHSNDSIITTRTIEDWHQDSEDTYTSIIGLDIENQERVRSILIAAYAIVTPPGIPIEDRVLAWQDKNHKLRQTGILTPKWLLTWKGTIYIDLPPHKLVEYFKNYEVEEENLIEIVKNLKKIFSGLAELSLNPLGLLHHLRTDSFRVYYCGMGFDVGEPDLLLENKMNEYEKQVLPYMPDLFQQKYNQIQS